MAYIVQDFLQRMEADELLPTAALDLRSCLGKRIGRLIATRAVATAAKDRTVIRRSIRSSGSFFGLEMPPKVEKPTLGDFSYIRGPR
jgi:hypothetical protein